MSDLLASNNEEPTVYGFGVGFNSTFNKARFNLISFNISNGVGWLEVVGLESITSLIAPGTQVFLELVLNERIDSEVEGSANKFVGASGSETVSQSTIYAITFIASQTATEKISATLSGNTFLFLSLHLNETVSADTRIVGVTYVSGTGSEAVSHNVIRAVTYLKGETGSEVISQDTIITDDVKLKTTFAESVSATAVIGQDVMFDDVTGNAIVNAVANIGQNTKLDTEGLELVSITANIDATEEKVCILTLTLKPGHRLIIDANTYNVWLDDENAVYVQSGDWIDELNRNTLELSIMAASGVTNLSARVVYQERYL